MPAKADEVWPVQGHAQLPPEVPPVALPPARETSIAAWLSDRPAAYVQMWFRAPTFCWAFTGVVVMDTPST